MRESERQAIDRWTRRLLHTSMHSRCIIWVGGRIQEDINGLRESAGLEPFHWGDYVADVEVKRCSVHTTSDCEGQETHG